ncbi:hypothetical protein AURDEDRAFT_184899 [Auricularia subglabra TFB-10046 SS5]|nr:hypothetical protein AURDEDRAFT_184899 [Auricularia subglabra TFB-10046 SS5]
MSTMADDMEEVLALLGGATNSNANLIVDAVYRLLRGCEAQLLRRDEASEIRDEDTTAAHYPVPASHLPTLPLTFLPPPPNFPFVPYNTLLFFIEARLVAETARFNEVTNFAVREARSLLTYRILRRNCRKTLAALLSTDDPAPSPPTGPGRPFLADTAPMVHGTTAAYYPMDVCAPGSKRPREIWELHSESGDVLELEIDTPLVNTLTRRVPPYSLDTLICIMQDHALWNKERTLATLEMLGAAIIPALTFIRPPNFVVAFFCSGSGSVSALKYTFDGDSTTAELQLHDGRKVTLLQTDRADDSTLFAVPSLGWFESLTLSNTLHSTTIPQLWKWSPRKLETMEIEVDGRLVTAPHANLLAFRGRGWRSCPKLAVLRLSAPRGALGPVEVRSDELKSFLSCAFPRGMPAPRVELNGVIISG